MGFFSNSSPFDADVEKATNEKNTSEEWGVIMDICDKVGNSSQNAKDCLRSIVRRLNAPDPHIAMQAVTLLDACASNCGKTFHLEIASRDFEGELRKLLVRSQPKLAEKLKSLLKKWAEGDFKTDSQLNLIPSLYNKLKSEGLDFSSTPDMPKHAAAISKDPNVVTNSQEEEDIAKAIELSLKENKSHHHSTSASHNSPSTKRSTNLYPSVNTSLNLSGNNTDGRKVRALYDFEAAEDNELTFLAGEIIHILDDTDQNWWKGSNHRGEGLFPSNFVTADLSVEPEQFTKLEHGNKKSVQFAEEVEIKTVKQEPEIIEVEIDEHKMDRLLHLLHEADPECDTTDTQEMIDLEEQVTAMGPLIDAALEKVDRRHAQLTQLSSDLVEALNLYHTLMREPPPPTPSNYTLPKMPQPHVGAYQYQNQGPPPPLQMFNGMPQQPSFNTGGLPPPPPPGSYPPGIPGSEYMGAGNMGNVNVNMPRFHMQPGPPPPQSGHPQGPLPPSDHTNLRYQPQRFPPQLGPPPGVSYQGPQQQGGGPPINQQPQYAPPNGQHMM